MGNTKKGDGPGRFKPGQSGNPKGPGRLPPEIKQARKLNRVWAAQQIATVFDGDRSAMRSVIKTQASKIGEVIIAKLALLACRGNISATTFLFDRLIGKPTDHVEISTPKPTIIQRRNGDQEILAMVEPDAIGPIPIDPPDAPDAEEG